MPKLSTLLDESVLENFWYFVQERHNIYWRRFVKEKPAPWTKDKTLRNYFFTNVYRELDRGSLYLTEEILPQYDKPKDKLFAILVYRYFNHIPTWEALQAYGDIKLGRWYWKRRAQYLKRVRKSGEQIFTSAFTVTGNRFGGFDDKIDNVCWLIEWLQDYLLKSRLDIFTKRPAWTFIWQAETMEEAFNEVKKMKGFGAFLAYEIVIDINYGHRGWTEDSFVNAGPGALRGLLHIFPRLERRKGVRAIKWLAKRQPTIHHGGRLTLRNIEHSLCEYQKYVKRRDGKKGGRARQFLAPSKKPLPGRR